MALLRLMMYSYLLIPYQKLFKDIHLYCKTRLFLKGIIIRTKFVSGLAGGHIRFEQITLYGHPSLSLLDVFS